MYYDLWAYTPSTFTLNWTPLLSNPTTHHYLTCQDLCSFLVQHCLWIPSKTQPVAPVFRHHRMIPRANELKLPLRIWRNLRSLFWWGFFLVICIPSSHRWHQFLPFAILSIKVHLGTFALILSLHIHHLFFTRSSAALEQDQIWRALRNEDYLKQKKIVERYC